MHFALSLHHGCTATIEVVVLEVVVVVFVVVFVVVVNCSISRAHV